MKLFGLYTDGLSDDWLTNVTRGGALVIVGYVIVSDKTDQELIWSFIASIAWVALCLLAFVVRASLKARREKEQPNR